MILESGMCGVRRVHVCVCVCVMGVSVTRSLPTHTHTHTLPHRIRCWCIFGEKPDLKILAHKYCHHQPRKPTQRGQTWFNLAQCTCQVPHHPPQNTPSEPNMLPLLPSGPPVQRSIILPPPPPPPPPPLKPCPLWDPYLWLLCLES